MMILDRFSGGEGVDPMIDFTLEGTHARAFDWRLQADRDCTMIARLRPVSTYRHQVIMYPSDPFGSSDRIPH